MFYLSAVTEKLQSNCQSAAKLQLIYRFCAVGITEPKFQYDCAVGWLACSRLYLFIKALIPLINQKSNIAIKIKFIIFLQPYIEEIFHHLRGEPFKLFLER